MNAEIPDFIAKNPDTLRAYLAGQARAGDDLQNPDQQLLPNPRMSVGDTLPKDAKHEQVLPTDGVRRSIVGSFDQDTGGEVVEHRPVEENTPTEVERNAGSAAIKGFRNNRRPEGRVPNPR